MTGIAQWLASLGLDKYAGVFAEAEVDLDVLRDLTEADLEKLGIPLGPRKKLLKAVSALRGKSAGSTPPAETVLRSGPNLVRGEAERRQLTVMFIDLVGSTALSARLDPEDMRLVIRAYQDACSGVVARYDGFVAKFMGDGVLAYFGYPRAHEDDAERAVRAGLEIVEAVCKLGTPVGETLAVRLGIATGLVVVGDLIGEGSAQEQAVVGDTPNLAARLQGLAEPGTMIIAGSTRRLLGALFRLRDLGPQVVKGVAQPVEAWAVAGIAAVGSRFEAATRERLTPLVGREQEIALLMERWSTTRRGEGQVVLLSGEPGIGKSRILGALRDRLDPQGAQALRFQCSPYYVNSPFWPHVDNFERTLKFERDETPASRLDKLEALVVGHYGRPRSDVRFLASMLSISCDERYGPLAMTPQRLKDETFRVLVDLCDAAARRQPSVLLYEDVHWADPTSLEVLDLLLDRARSMPLLVVLTHRPEFTSRWSQHGHVVTLNLSRLTRAQSAAMVTRVAEAKALPADLLEQILTKTDGVPLFVEELTRSILESRELMDAGDRYEYAGTARHITIPATLRDSLMARLDRFMPVKEIAQIGAAIGREFSHELIAAVAPPQARVDDALARLTESGLAFRRGTPPEATYTFKHALVQDAAYDSLLRSRRQELHGRIARVIRERFPAIVHSEPEVLAHHYTQAGQTPSALPLWQKAGELALARMALAEAISHLNKGLELAATLPASAERGASELALRVPLGTAWVASTGWQDAEVWNSLHPALALAKSLKRNDALLPILVALTCHVVCQGRVAEALHWANETIDTGRLTGDNDFLISGHTLACTCCFWAGKLTESLQHSDQVWSRYEDDKHRHLVNILNHDPKTVAGIHSSLCWWMLGYPERAVSLSDEKDAHARRQNHPFDLAYSLHVGSDVFSYRYESSVLHRRAEEIERLGREHSLLILLAFFAPVRSALALVHEGKAAESVAAMRGALEFWEATGGKSYSPYLKAVLAECLAQLGDLDGALELVDEQLTQMERPGWEERAYYAEVLRMKGWMLWRKGDLEGAERNFQASLDWAREQQARSWQLRTSTCLARLWQAQGRHREAHELLAPVYRWFTEGFDTKDLRDAKALLDELEDAA